ncbi:MAG: hypothetical protein OER88_12350, partial [Planctomycetota bacterium]|nr:hypothetical protein [Planctomycetota bacterium]
MRTLALLVLAGLALAQDPAALAPKVTDYPTKFRLIGMGAKALAPLMAQIGSDDPRLAFESRSAVRWIVNRAPDRDAMVQHVAPFAAGTQPEATRAFAAQLLGDLRSPAAVPVLEAMIGKHESVALAAVEALARTPGTAATETLIEAHERSRVRAAVWRALG